MRPKPPPAGDASSEPTHTYARHALRPSCPHAERELDQAALINKGDPNAYFESLKKLGEGASGTVYLATDRRTGAKVAIKMAPATDLANLKTEIAIQKLSAHPSVVSYIETYLCKDQLWVRARSAAGCSPRGFVTRKRGGQITSCPVALCMPMGGLGGVAASGVCARL